MKSEMGVNRPQKTKYPHRLLAMLLCVIMVFSLCGNAVIVLAQELNSWVTSITTMPEETREETADEIRLRLLRQIRAGWDPYSEDMTLEEFYVLMDMFGDGTLPLKNTAQIAALNSRTDSVTIPRKMFLFAGLSEAGITEKAPLEYNNETGAADENGNYPAGLDPYGAGYMRPPMEWSGVVTEGMLAVVIRPDINKDNSAVAGDVDQSLFLSYDGYYVRRVTAENIDATILGVIQKPNSEEYVYYYLSAEDQNTKVSTTTLPLGKKFVIQYVPNEHAIEYKVYLNDQSGEVDWDNLSSFNSFTDITDNLVDLAGYSDTWVDSVFGASRPFITTDGAYSFDVSTPYEYEVRLYRQKGNEIGQYTGKGNNLMEGYFINDGYPLGAEPVYKLSENKLMPNKDEGPSVMTTNATLYNNLVKEDRVVIAVVTKKGTPKFDAYRLLPSINNTSRRGTSALVKIKAKIKGTGEEVEIPYDYEDLYLWATGGNSKYDYYENSSSLGGANKGNIAAGNIATADNWGWNTRYAGISDADMNYNEEDGTYSYQWTWQTNSDEAFLLDTLEVNGVAIAIPYLPKDSVHSGTAKAATKTGVRGYYTETTLPDGATLRVEMLMAFAGRPQRVYRFTVTGARTNVTLTNMNLFMSGGGAPEVSVYSIEGVYADYEDRVDTAQSPSIQYFGRDKKWTRSVLAEVLVEQDNPVDGIYFTGDEDYHYASVRFKLADGYGNPYYIFESPYTGIIDGQASAVRNEDGTVTPNSNRIRKMSDLAEGEVMDPQYIYQGDDGWYYIRLTGHPQDKFALLTIGAIRTRYVVHYIPETDEVSEPSDMPTFEHTIGVCPSFLTDDTTFPMHEYDDNAGLFYDSFKNNIIAIPSNSYGVIQPTDPDREYVFVDWVLVDAYGNPVLVDTNRKQIVSDVNGNLLLVDTAGNPVVMDTAGNLADGTDLQVLLDDNGVAVLVDANGKKVNGFEPVLRTRDGNMADKNGNPVTVTVGTAGTNWEALNTDGGRVALDT